MIERSAQGGRGFAPARMSEVELTRPLPAVAPGGKRLWVLARLHTEPVGVCEVRLPPAGLAAAQMAALLWQDLREPVRARCAAAGLPAPDALPAQGLPLRASAWPFLRERREALAAAPFISVVLCTRDRADRLADSLDRLEEQDYPHFEVVVVDNAPTGDAVAAVVASRGRGARCLRVVEPRPGLSWARNAGVAASRGEIVAFLDDDEAPDRCWLAAIARGFARGADVGAVTGLILPALLDTPEQEIFETAGGHSKGRGLAPAVMAADGPQSPLFPLPPFGAGGNMAFRRETLRRIGGFDVAMGAGTPARGGEDTLALTLTLLAGYRIAYEPAAFVRHEHYRDLAGLSRQVHGYGVGLTAYYAALLRRRPGLLPELLRLVPGALRYLRAGAGEAGGALPAGLRRRQRAGMLAGPAAYARSVRRQRAIAGEARR